ncbi:MAG: FAD-dependent oxidoreductase, partial [Rhodococcus sp. (in: high G+C Gram-positive bacteria)]
MDTAREPNLEKFARDATGFAVLTPEDPAYDGSTEIWNGFVTARPRVLVRATRAEHVQEALRIAAKSNMPVSVKSGGHDWAGRALTAGGLTVDLSAMREVRIDVDRRLARLGGGARLADVVDAAGAHGLAAATGTYSDVGYTGWAIGGGYGPLSGIVGLGADNIVEAQLVTADGSIVTASQQQDADLL